MNQVEYSIIRSGVLMTSYEAGAMAAAMEAWRVTAYSVNIEPLGLSPSAQNNTARQRLRHLARRR
jgi:hypothetical protein